MDHNEYNKHLAESFTSHYKLPVVVTTVADNFFYELDFYEDVYCSRTRWNEMVDEINRVYAGNPEFFLQEYYRVRDAMIASVTGSEEHARFTQGTELIDEYRKIEFPASVYSSMYNNETIGRRFMSVDIKEANFQVYRYLGIINADTYLDYLKTFTDDFMAAYIAGGKYTRQAVFGHKSMNPKRTIMVERMLLLDVIEKLVKPVFNGKLVFFGNDEAFIELGPDDDPDKTCAAVTEAVANAPVPMRVECFTMDGYNIRALHSDGTEHKIGELYRRSCDAPGKFKDLPRTYSKVVRRLMAGEEPTEMDRMFIYNDILVKFVDDIVIEKIEKKVKKF